MAPFDSRRSEDVPGPVFSPAAAGALTEFDIRLIASGGMVSGAGLAAALALGADAANMGTRLISSTEALVHENVKQQIVNNSELFTLVVFRKFHNSARLARNSVSEEIAEISSREDATLTDIAHLASGARENVLGKGEMENGMWWASQAQGVIHEVDTVENLVNRIVEAGSIINERLASMAGAIERVSSAVTAKVPGFDSGSTLVAWLNG